VGVNVAGEGRVLVGLIYGLGEGVQLGVKLREGVNVYEAVKEGPIVFVIEAVTVCEIVQPGEGV
jgi:hypothetical protein